MYSRCLSFRNWVGENSRVSPGDKKCSYATAWNAVYMASIRHIDESDLNTFIYI